MGRAFDKEQNSPTEKRLPPPSQVEYSPGQSLLQDERDCDKECVRKRRMDNPYDPPLAEPKSPRQTEYRDGWKNLLGRTLEVPKVQPDSFNGPLEHINLWKVETQNLLCGSDFYILF